MLYVFVKFIHTKSVFQSLFQSEGTNTGLTVVIEVIWGAPGEMILSMHALFKFNRILL